MYQFRRTYENVVSIFLPAYSRETTGLDSSMTDTIFCPKLKREQYQGPEWGQDLFLDHMVS